MTLYYMDENAFIVGGSDISKILTATGDHPAEDDMFVVGNWWTAPNSFSLVTHNTPWAQIGRAKGAHCTDSACDATWNYFLARLMLAPPAGAYVANLRWVGYPGYAEVRTTQPQHWPFGLPPDDRWFQSTSAPHAVWLAHGSMVTASGWAVPLNKTGLDLTVNVHDKGTSGTGHLEVSYVYDTMSIPTLTRKGIPRCWKYSGGAWRAQTFNPATSQVGASGHAVGRATPLPKKSVSNVVSAIGTESLVWDGSTWRAVH